MNVAVGLLLNVIVFWATKVMVDAQKAHACDSSDDVKNSVIGGKVVERELKVISVNKKKKAWRWEGSWFVSV